MLFEIRILVLVFFFYMQAITQPQLLFTYIVIVQLYFQIFLPMWHNISWETIQLQFKTDLCIQYFFQTNFVKDQLNIYLKIFSSAVLSIHAIRQQKIFSTASFHNVSVCSAQFTTLVTNKVSDRNFNNRIPASPIPARR